MHSLQIQHGGDLRTSHFKSRHCTWISTPVAGLGFVGAAIFTPLFGIIRRSASISSSGTEIRQIDQCSVLHSARNIILRFRAIAPRILAR
jgi:hypothetical protein